MGFLRAYFFLVKVWRNGMKAKNTKAEKGVCKAFKEEIPTF